MTRRKKLDEPNRITSKPPMLARRFVFPWSRRQGSRANNVDAKRSRAYGDFRDGSDTAAPTVGWTDEAGDSSSTQYSDAHSTFEFPMGGDDDVAVRFSAESKPTGSEDGGVSSQDGPDLSRFVGALDSIKTSALQASSAEDASTMVDVLPMSNQIQLAESLEATSLTSQMLPSPCRESSPLCFVPTVEEEGDDSAAENSIGNSTPSDKGKAADVIPDLNIATRSLSILKNNGFDSDDQEALKRENTFLRAELAEVERVISTLQGSRASTMDSKHNDQTTPPATPPQPTRRRGESRQRDVSIFETTTLRDLVLKRLFAPPSQTADLSSVESNGQDKVLTLDTPLTPAQVQDFTQVMNNVMTTGQTFKQPIALCAVCHLPKFKEARGLNHKSYISEIVTRFPSISASFEDFHPVWGVSTCCRRYVCNTCLCKSITAGISTQWWQDLGNHEVGWLKCPVPCCGHSLPLQSSVDVLAVLQTLGAHDIPDLVRRYEHASELRAALKTLSPLPDRSALRESRTLHLRLVRYSRMLPFLEDVRTEDGKEPLPIKAELFPVDTLDGEGTINVPIFTHLLRPRTSRTCVICAEEYQEFDRGSPEHWAKATRPFGGEWTWRVLDFPIPSLLPHCQHPLDICRTCLSTHITTQIEVQGPGVVDNIACPGLDCTHKFTHAEVRHLASQESFASYERYLVLNSVSHLPNFRWCLREGCTSGALYDEPGSSSSSPSSSPNHPRGEETLIVCADCQFAMCYRCQTPWHAHQTCHQSSSQRTHGDPNWARTQSWLARHTKPCPGAGCGVLITKGNGCFHMTCSRCRAEFCWECLADWRDIVAGETEGGGLLLRREGHREGCYFRSRGARLPTQIMGQDLRDALGEAGT